MNYKIAQIKLFFNRFFGRILDFFDAVSFNTRRTVNSVKNHERAQVARYHLKRASKKIVSTTKENKWNWNHRLASSESFRIFDDDV